MPPPINLHNWNYKADQLLDKVEATLEEQRRFFGAAAQRTVIFTTAEGRKDHVITRLDVLAKTDPLPESKIIDYGTIALAQENLSIEEFKERLALLQNLQLRVGSHIFQFTQQFGFSDQIMPSNNDYGERPGKLFDVNMPGVQIPTGPLLHHELPSYTSAYAAIEDFLLLKRFNGQSDSRLGHLLVYIPNCSARFLRLELQYPELMIEMEANVPVESLTLDITYENEGQRKQQKVTPQGLRTSCRLAFSPQELRIWLFSKQGDLIDFHEETSRYSMGVNSILPKITTTGPLSLDDDEVFETNDTEHKNTNIFEKTTTIEKAKQSSGKIDIAIRALADSPSEIDLLDFGDYAQALADFIESEKTQTPLTIGIDGSWGMGKTTLMKMLRERLTKSRTSPPVFTVWFNAWKYDREESLWAALALEILAQVRRQLGRRKRLSLLFRLNMQRFDKEELFKNLLRSVIYPGILVLLSIAGIVLWKNWIGSTLDFSKWSKIITSAGAIGGVGLFLKRLRESITTPFELGIFKYIRKPDYKERLGFLAEFERDFSFVINAVTQNGKSSLVIFVDDLDRCKPAKPVEVIEAINQLLDAEPCIFVIGMDVRTVATSIQT